VQAVKALRDVRCNVVGLVSIFTYGFAEAAQNFAEAKCPIFSLCSYEALIKVAVDKSYVLESDIDMLEQWRKDPSSWSPKD